MISIFPFVTYRGALAAAGFLGMLGLEQVVPFKPPVDRRLPRYARNLFLTLFNAAALEAVFGGAVLAVTLFLESRRVGFLHWLALPAPVETLLTIAYLDLATWWFHWAYHNSPALWRLHRVHHSDLDLDVTSASRFHIGEILLSTVYRLAMVALIGPAFEAVLAFEASLLLFAQLQHSNVRLPEAVDRTLRLVFVTPDMHRVHHSDVRSHTNSNFSTVFSVWDRLFGTYRVEGIDQAGIRIGLPEYRKPEEVTLLKLLAMPLAPACSANLRG